MSKHPSDAACWQAFGKPLVSKTERTKGGFLVAEKLSTQISSMGLMVYQLLNSKCLHVLLVPRPSVKQNGQLPLLEEVGEP